MKKSILILGFASSVFAANIMPYIGGVTYKDSNKDNAIFGGVYTKFNYTKYSNWQIDFSTLKIKYDNSPNYYQGDLTIIYHRFYGLNWDTKIGIHTMYAYQNNDKTYNKLFIGGIKYYKILNYDMGSDLYIGDYSDFKSYQISPKIGINFGDYNSLIGSFYFNLSGDLIHLTKNVNNKSNFADVNVLFGNYHKHFDLIVSGSFGKTAYKVSKSGFVVSNLDEITKYQYGTAFNIKFNENNALKVGYKKSKFEDTNNKEGWANSYSLMYSFKF